MIASLSIPLITMLIYASAVDTSHLTHDISILTKAHKPNALWSSVICASPSVFSAATSMVLCWTPLGTWVPNTISVEGRVSQPFRKFGHMGTYTLHQADYGHPRRQL